MNEQPWHIEFYRDERGREPVRDFIRELQPGMRAKMIGNLDVLAAQGLALSMPLARPIAGHGLWELRTQWAGNITRMFYFAVTGRRIVLLHAFVKKTQETPRREIEVADRRRVDFLRREP
jgi:phage-related protein